VRLHVNDPGHAGLRRAVRATVAVVAGLAIATAFIPGTPGVVLAAFGAFTLVATADFGGSVRRRVEAYLGCAVAGAILIVIGVLASGSIPAVIVVTFIITAALSFTALLRGTLASAAPALTIVYVVAVMVSASPSDLGVMLIGYGIAIIVGLLTTLLVLPRKTLAPMRKACAGALHALADVQRRRMAGGDADLDALRAANDRLRQAYLGNPFRSTGLHSPDRALLTLAGQIQALIAGVIRRGPQLTPPGQLPASAAITQVTADDLETLAHCLDSGRGQPSDERLVHLWEQQRAQAVDLIADAHAGPDSARLQTVNNAFVERVMALATIRLTVLVRRVLSLPEQSHDGARPIPEPLDFPPWQQLRAQFTLKSPWMRTALRSGAALAVAAAVVEIVGVANGFWVLLGALTVLRRDTSDTLRMSLLALAGTFVGALIGGGLLLWLTPERWVYAVLLVVMAFLAVYSQTTAGFLLSQATFSIYVIVVFSLVRWPPDLGTAATRVEDIALGVGISLGVALLMWPRGVLAGLRVNVTDAIAASRHFLDSAMQDFIHGPGHVGTSDLDEMRMSMARSYEVVNALMNSHSAASQQKAGEWAELLDNLRTVGIIGSIVMTWSTASRPVAEVVPSLVTPLEQDTRETSDAWGRVAHILEGASASAAPAAFRGRVIDALAGVQLTDRDVADRVVSAIWEDAWLSVAEEAASTSEEPARALA
jgi:uncharacterized membrane protein YccC